MKKIVTTVGTSIFTNYRDEEVKKRFGDYVGIDVPYDRTKDIPASGIYDDNCRTHICTLKETIEDYWYKDENDKPNSNASAEIASILKIAYEENEPCEVHLIATDTLHSVLAAELIVDWFEKFSQPKVSKVLFQRQDTEFKEQKDSEHVVKDLRVDSHKDYEKGFFNLFDLLDGLIKVSEKENNEVVFNITGGYKALIPIVTLYAQTKRIPLKYLYESYEGKEEPLISLAALPFHFDWGLLELLADYIQNEDLRVGLPETNEEALDLLRRYRIVKNQTTELTIIGTLIKKFVDQRLWEGKSSFGYIAEYKVYEVLIEEFNERPKRGVEYFWDINSPNQYSEKPKYDRDNAKEKCIEFDLISESDGKQIWYEVKSFSKTGLRKALNQAKTKIEFQQAALKAPLDRFRLVLYKFDFKEIKTDQQLSNIEKVFKKAGVKYEIWYFDVPANLDLEKVKNKSFLEKKIELKKLDIPNFDALRQESS